MPPIGGLAKLNIPTKKAPIKGAVADSLKAQPRATGAGTRGAIGVGRTGALNQGATMALFGIHAQRNNHLIGNVKAGYSAGISNIRHQLLGLRGNSINIGMPIPQPKAQANDSYMDTYMKMMELQMLTKGITEVGTGIAGLAQVLKSDNTDKAKNPKPEKQEPALPKQEPKADPKATTTAGGKVTADVQAKLDAMAQATDSKTLEPAINNAKSELQGNIDEKASLEGEKKGLENEKQALEKDVQSAKAAVDKNQEQITAKNKQKQENEKAIETNKLKIQENEAKIAKLDPTKDAAEIEKLQKENKGLESANNVLTNANKILDQGLSALRIESGKLTQNVHAAEAKVTAKQGEIDKVAENISNTEANITELQTAIPKYEVKLGEFQAKEQAQAASAGGDMSLSSKGANNAIHMLYG